MGFGEYGIGRKLFGHLREKEIVNWRKGHNAKLHNLLPSLTRFIYLYIYVCVCVWIWLLYAQRDICPQAFPLFEVCLILAAFCSQCWDGE